MANVTTKRMTLDYVQAIATHCISDLDIARVGGIETYAWVMLPMAMANLVITLVNLSAAENLEDIEIKYPLNWWEAFKEATAPQMFLDRFPVKYRRHHIAVKAIWKSFKPKPGTEKYGPFLPYVLETSTDDLEDM